VEAASSRLGPKVAKISKVWVVLGEARHPLHRGALRKVEVMIPALIWDLRERFPPFDVAPSEGPAYEGTSCHCGTSSHIGYIDFDHQRSRTISPVRPEVEKGSYLED
jgi:hypothetical protein